MEGKTVLVTGATSGIGFYTARDLTSRGARVIITGRDAQRGREAVRSLRRQVGDGRVEFLSADHSTVGGNRELAERFRGHEDRLDGLVNNVGGFYNDRVETEDGYEATLTMNLVGPFALTEALLPILKGSGPTRVIITGRDAQRGRGPFGRCASGRETAGSSSCPRTIRPSAGTGSWQSGSGDTRSGSMGWSTT